MSDEEAEDFKNSIYPVGKERWIKVKFIDRDKSMKAFRWKNGEEHDSQGYAVTAIGLRDEYMPQISALMSLSDEVGAHLLRILDTEEVKDIITMFSNKIEELKQTSIQQQP